MGRLVYTANTSLDGYIEDADGSFDWGVPDEELHLFYNDLLRGAGPQLYGRRLYDSMVYWETFEGDGDDGDPVQLEFGEIWRSLDKVVFSRTLDAVRSERTVLERELTIDVVERLKAFTDADLTIGGAELAARAVELGLVDEVRVLLFPVTVGAGKPALPGGVGLDLLEQRRFGCGVALLRYAVRR